MSVIHNPHDKFFKSSMANLRVAQEFFQNHLPQKIRKYLDFSSLELHSGSYIDEEFKHTSSDMLYSAYLLDKSEKVYLYILAEHQSSVYYYMPLRLWRYTGAIWHEHLKKCKIDKKAGAKLPLVVPLVFYNGPKRYDGPRDIKEIIDAPLEFIEQFLYMPFHLVDTNDIEDEELREQRWSDLMEFAMKRAFEREALQVVESLLERLNWVYQEQNSVANNFADSVLRYFLSQVGTTNPTRLKKTLELGLFDSTGDKAMIMLGDYLAEQRKDSWLQEGREEGRQEGRQEGITILLRQLERKFGAVSPKYWELIQSADSKTLLKWAEKILDTNDIKEIFEV